MDAASPIPTFLAAFRGGPDGLGAFLAEDVTFEAGDLPTVQGRHALLRLWRRLFQTYVSIDIALVRHVPDGDLVIAEQRQVFTPRGREPVRIDSIVIYTLKGGLIASWSDHMELEEMPGEDQALWRRLWSARW